MVRIVRRIAIAVLSCALFLAPVHAGEPSPHEKLQAVELHTLTGEVNVFYSKGFEKRAGYFQEMAIAASHYFEKEEILGLDIDFSFAVLGPEDWAAFTKLPYGMAHILSEPYTAVVAATGDNILVQDFLRNRDRVPAETVRRIEESGSTFEAAAITFVDMIGFHEMGHIYAEAYGAHTWPEQRWLSEFVATYLAYTFMKENRPDLASLWNLMIDLKQSAFAPEHTTLADFESLYLGVGSENYGWYQSRFHQKGVEVYEKTGISFIHALKKSLAGNPEAAKEDPYRLKELTAISDLFDGWATGPDGDIAPDAEIVPADGGRL